MLLIVGYVLSASRPNEAQAGPWHWFQRQHGGGLPVDGVGQEWAWVGSPDQQQVVVASLYNRYCTRCHGVDGRGTWDMPNLPDFTDPHWQSTRSDAMIQRAIIEGRWWCMPTFRAVLSCQEAAALTRYIRTFVPGTEVAPPVIPASKKTSETPKR
jgi:hypothetical protein